MPSAPPAEREWRAAPGVLTDWEHNVDYLLRQDGQPEAFSGVEIRGIIIRFIAHVPNHVAAAKKLAGMGPFEDIFKAGVLEDEE